MALNKLYYVYGLDTACFYNDEENNLEKKLVRARCLLSKLEKELPPKPKLKSRKYKEWYIKYREWENKHHYRLDVLRRSKIELKEELKKTLENNKDLVRVVREDKILDKKGNPQTRRRVSIFDSCLTRCFDLKEREFNTEIIIVKVYFFDVAESIVKHGFYMNGEKYVFFSASAGQIRTKKLVAVKETLLNTYWNTLTAGLTIDKINAQGGMNINKFLAYLALCNSATDLWFDFDIDKSIVVDDFENTVNGDVDFIDEKTYDIARQNMDVEITQTDGCGMILPSISDRNFMVRLPWVKGLLAKFDFIKFIQENNGNPVITDIYGDKHNIIDENIEIIFTKSQFKMWKFFKNWNEYKDNFKKYSCSAGKCNVEEDVFLDSVINYQMIQTLSDINVNELTELAKVNNKDIKQIASNTDTMLRMLGATEWNVNKNGYQKCLMKYPELLYDCYSRQTVRNKKVSLENDLWSARFSIGGKYTFVIPDLYAFCEWLFLGAENPKGLLNDGEVCCKLYGNGDKLDCLRSPHLYREHPIRLNKTNIKWFDTNAIYVSCHDLISKIVMCDWDGDKLLVSNNSTLVSVAERNMKGIVPLFYNMGKAKAEILTPAALFKGLLLAYNGGNIGAPSNDITKIWNSGKISQEQLDVVKWLVMEVNFIIDYSKTLYKPSRPEYANTIITKYTKAKVPFFFQYAKKKKDNQVEEQSKCAVDMVRELFPKRQIKYNFTQKNIGEFDYKVLMNNPDIVIDMDVVDNFKDITRKLNFNNVSDETMFSYLATYDDAKKRILDTTYSTSDIIDMIIKELFLIKKTSKKTAFWTLFGEEVYENVCKNIDNDFVQCKQCHKRFHKESQNQKYCLNCQSDVSGLKMIICRDCGRKFYARSKDNSSVRCLDCYRKYRKEYYKIKKQEQRAKLKMSTVQT